MQIRTRGFLLDAFSHTSILNHMVKYRDETLDRTFAALSDPTRRALLARLGERDGLSVSELAAPFPVSLPAIMKHLDVLTDAGLIVREKTGRTVSCRLTAQPMEQAMNWLNRYAQFWSDKFDRLAAFVEEETWPTQPSTPIPAQPNVQASRSRAGSAHGRRKSTPPGRKPRS
ncbi:transcriptional regulator [Bradyrhizobium japonicum]|nr:ArsR family transcriptional regulator [Bradyrhizobium japonicum]BAL06146.1 transcriptional regulatory protein [Bradyrhizobium japonicum USDA 6]GEC50055.1 transcriptional regulator [Bradyrhizobium japonicum]